MKKKARKRGKIPQIGGNMKRELKKNAEDL